MTSDAKLPIATACPICSEGHPAGRSCSAPYERSPLADEINELPERLRSWIHDLETNADPAGTLRENFVLRENVAALGAKVEEAEMQLDQLAGAVRLFLASLGGKPYRADVVVACEDALADIEAKEERSNA